MIVTCPECGSAALAEIEKATYIRPCTIKRADGFFESEYTDDAFECDPVPQDEILCTACAAEFKLVA